MNVDNVVASLAFGVGIVQMYNDYKNSDKVTITSRDTLLLGVLGSSLWLIYQSRRYGFNFTVAYTLIGLFLQIYILKKTLDESSKLKFTYM